MVHTFPASVPQEMEEETDLGHGHWLAIKIFSLYFENNFLSKTETRKVPRKRQGSLCCLDLSASPLQDENQHAVQKSQ